MPKDHTAGTAPRPVLYGRRRGRRIRPTGQGLLDELLPRLRVEVPDAGPLDPASLFGAPPRDVWLEIGFGGGEHLAAQAEAHPDVGLIGCEPFLNGVVSLLKHVEARGIGNVRVLPDDARPLLGALADASIGRAFVLFPDPWPKARHHFRRFIGPQNLDAVARILKDGAELRLASDVPDLAAWMDEHASAHAAFERVSAERSRPADWPPTRYEQKAVAQGREPVYFTFRRRRRD